MMQNISLCQKYKVRTAIGSFAEYPFHLRAPHDIISLFIMLGMDTKKIKESLNLDL
jgi:RNase P/RNase MRP subunit p30